MVFSRGDRCDCRIIHSEKVEAAARASLSANELNGLSQIFKAFADPSRLKILGALAIQEMCVCDLAALLNVSESAVSHQLRLLRTLQLVANRREGTVLYYRLNDGHISTLMAIGLEHLREQGVNRQESEG